LHGSFWQGPIYGLVSAWLIFLIKNRDIIGKDGKTLNVLGGSFVQGPIYGLVGAWLIFLIKNREVIGKEKADNMTRQAIFLSALNVALGNPLPIDDW
jgi:hypothetical protein